MTWSLLIGMTLLTFANRFAFFTRSLKYQPGLKVRRFLSFSSYAILTAIWTPIMFNYSTVDGFDTAGVDYLVAGFLAALLSFMGIRNIFVVLLSTAVFFILRLVL